MAERPIPLLSPAAATEALEGFIFGGLYAPLMVPSNIARDFVAAFIRTRVTRATDSAAFNQARRVVDYYDLNGVVEHFQKMLDRKEKTEVQIEQSCRCLSVLGEQGGAEAGEFAVQYFAHLAVLPSASENYDVLIETVETLGPAADGRVLADRLAREMKALEPRMGQEPDAADQYERLDQYLNNDLAGALEARERRFQVTGLKDPVARIDELCRVYAEWERDGTPESPWWSSRAIRREARADRGKLVLETFRRLAAEVHKAAIPREERAFFKVRIYRAILFFGGELTDQQQRELALAGAENVDILHNSLGM